MRSLDEIKRINECLDPDDDWRDSAVPIIPRVERPPPRILEAPPMYKYVKETFNVPATWWDHFKIHARGHAAVHYGDWGYRLACRLFKNIKSTRIPVVYEIHAVSKRRGAK